jgi:hypothetical protein
VILPLGLHNGVKLNSRWPRSVPSCSNFKRGEVDSPSHCQSTAPRPAGSNLCRKRRVLATPLTRSVRETAIIRQTRRRFIFMPFVLAAPPRRRSPQEHPMEVNLFYLRLRVVTAIQAADAGACIVSLCLNGGVATSDLDRGLAGRRIGFLTRTAPAAVWLHYRARVANWSPLITRTTISLD